MPNDFFKDSSVVISEYAQVIAWAASQNRLYMPNALNEFLDSEEADAFLVAFGLSDIENHIIVTQEISQPARRNKIKIPEPCNALNVPYVNTIEMFRQIGETF